MPGMQIMQQSEATAAQRVVYLFCVDATDGLTPETGENGGQPQIDKNGGGFNNTSDVLHTLGSGHYYVTLVAGELGTLGIARIRYKSAATAEAFADVQVVPWDPYDVAAQGMTALDQAVSAAKTLTSAYDAAKAAAPTGEAAAALASYDAPTKAELDAGLAALNDLSAAEVQAEAEDALETYHLDHLIPVAGTVTNSMTPGAGGFTTNLPFAYTNQYDEQTVMFVTGNLAGQSQPIKGTDEDPMTGGKLWIGCEEFPIAPAVGDQFGIIAAPTLCRDSVVAAINTFWNLGMTGAALESSPHEILDHVPTILDQAKKIDAAATTAPASATTGSLLDRLANKDGGKTYSQATDSLEGQRDTLPAAVGDADYAGYEALAKTGTKLGNMIAAIRAGQVGKLTRDGTDLILTLYEVDGATPIGTITLSADRSERTTGLA